MLRQGLGSRFIFECMCLKSYFSLTKTTGFYTLVVQPLIMLPACVNIIPVSRLCILGVFMSAKGPVFAKDRAVNRQELCPCGIHILSDE